MSARKPTPPHDAPPIDDEPETAEEAAEANHDEALWRRWMQEE